MGRFGNAVKAVKSGGSEGKYIKLEDGASVNFTTFDQPDPGMEVSYWKDGKKVDAGTPGAERNEKIVLGVYDVDAKRGRILRVGSGTFAKLGAKIDKGGEDRVYTVSREGVGMKTRYEVDRGDRLTDDQKTAIRAADTCDPLEEAGVVPLALAQPAAPEPAPKLAAPKPATQPDDDIPF